MITLFSINALSRKHCFNNRDYVEMFIRSEVIIIFSVFITIFLPIEGVQRKKSLQLTVPFSINKVKQYSIAIIFMLQLFNQIHAKA